MRYADEQSPNDKRVQLGALKFVLHAVMKLLEKHPVFLGTSSRGACSLPHHGCDKFCQRNPSSRRACVSRTVSSMWLAMRCEKHNHRHFKRTPFPPFDDKAPPLDYRDNILDVEHFEAIQLGLDEERQCYH
ncbi:uncharacterized protein FOMMEDRAFT_160268 [Fomitiporia mediterranea MF3/22]|uniref:uncharacterized protein n=1 Tax=Fomitiporia mediterranea (strain MF3/22) TaxID=694068 RepID=UPI000440974E|nr:uncharacterized protein FOMMEDRAFT_160268 [Fomitiporia mediterranea MF3/22]EJC99823.1 hypothetical protein FOMMEDRAFT_160268 [Fomitiporia mediterranea MF3/22]